MVMKVKDFREFKISKYRKVKKLSQEKLAELINMSRSSISNIEVNGCADINLIATLTEHLDFEVSIKNGFIKIIENLDEKGTNVMKKSNNTLLTNTNLKGTLIDNDFESYISELRSFVRYYISLNNINLNINTIPDSSYINIINALKDNTILLAEISDTNIALSIECTLYDGGDCYLNALNVFDDNKNYHLGSYFPVYNKDSLELRDLSEDDIWEYRDWIEVEK